MKIRNKNEGFSLIEVAIGLLIVGLIIGPEIEYYAAWKNTQVIELTVGNANTAKTALKKYALNNGCYPLPADPGSNLTNPTAGTEAVPAPGRTDCTDLTAGQLAAIPTCAGDDAVVCKTPCSGATPNCSAGSPVILIGELPYATLGLPKVYAVDGYGRKFTYAVSANLTGVTAFDNTKGAIAVSDLNGNSGNQGATIGPETNVHYALISHGRDALGAFTPEGVLNGNCPATGKDRENCNNDGLFDNGYGLYFDQNGVQQYKRLETTVAGVNHFDDFVYFDFTLSSDIWTKTTQAGAVGDIVSNTGGNVKVTQPTAVGGPSLAQAKLDVRGDVAADALWAGDLCDTSANSFTGPSTYTNKPCQPTKMDGTPGTNGFDPDVIAQPVAVADKTQQSGKGIHCGFVTTGDGTTTNGSAGNPMYGIAAADEECVGTSAVTAQVTYNIGSCPLTGGGSKQFPYGIDAMGNLLCSTAPHPP
ncbi:MAG TPA: type II secretion system protein [Patescibacteria group bacterium]|nr:type II secretion system protein [Patescibacteria group bacterium]